MIFCIFGCFSVFLLRKMWPEKNVKVSDYVKFSMKFSLESPQSCYMDSLYHAFQYVHDFQLIYFMIFCIFGCFSFFLLRKMWPEKNVKVSD